MQAKSIAPFGNSGDGSFWKGNIHCHSDRSDGRESVEAVVASYRSAGHDFVCITDHFEREYNWQVTDASDRSDASFVTIVGAEFSAGPWEDPDCYWINAIGLPPSFAPPSPEEQPEQMIGRAKATGAFMVLLHPGLNNLSLERALTLKHVDAVEIHNTNMVAQ